MNFEVPLRLRALQTVRRRTGLVVVPVGTALALLLFICGHCLSATALDLASSNEDLPREAGADESAGAGAAQSHWGPTLSEQLGHFLSDPLKWRWPIRNAPGPEQAVHAALIKWCGAAYAEAIAEAAEKVRTYQRLRAERAQRYNEWMQCKQERAVKEQEVEIECSKALALLASEGQRQTESLGEECEAQTKLLSSDLEACELKLKAKEETLCRRDLATEKATCEHTLRSLQANLTACQQTRAVGSPARLAELELAAAKFEQNNATWQQEKESLEATLAACRPARAHSEARLREVLADGTIEELERTALWLQVVVGLLLSLLLCLFGVIFWRAANEERVRGSGSFGWVGSQSAARMRLVSPEAARGLLEDAYEGHALPRLPVVLTSAVLPQGEGGTPLVFLLVPVNVASSRRFSLFNSGGDYVQHIEKAKEIVARAMERSRLVVVLYEGRGSLFSEKTLQSLRLTPDKVAYEALPKDLDFPKSHNLVVPWVDKALGVRVTDSERESELASVIKVQPWAQFLLLRSGRWGAAHAQI